MAIDLVAPAEQVVPQFYAHSETTKFVVGCDLGQSFDPTAVAVLEHTTGIVDYGTPLERHCGLSRSKQEKAVRCDVRHLERLPLGMSYPAVVDHMKKILARPPLCGGDGIEPATLVIDESGVGRAVGDIFNELGLEPIRVTITAGIEVTWVRSYTWHVPKSVLISTVDAMLHTGILKFAASLSEAPAMRAELLDFQRSLSAAGRATYQARVGRHDDMVLAVSLACWWLNQPEPGARAVIGSY